MSSGYRAEVNGKLKVTDEIQVNVIFASSDILCSGRIYSYSGARIYGTELSNYNYAQPSNDYFTNGGSIQNDSPTLNFGLYVQYTIRAQGLRGW